jgi:HAD superfamily hydrolase (TIGR01549 family)
MNKNRVIIFDFDGTIANTMEHVKDIFNEIAVEFNFRKIEESEWKKTKEIKTKDIFKKIGVSFFKLPKILKRVGEIVSKKIEKFRPIDGIKEALGWLNGEGYVLGILTSAEEKNVIAFLKNNHIDFFDFVYSSRDIFGKARKMEKLLKKENLKKERVVYVGDETRDIEAAKKTGVRSVAVTWGFNSKELLLRENPNFLVANPSELLDLFKTEKL